MTPDDRMLIINLAQEVGRLAGEAAGMQRAFDDLAEDLVDVRDEIRKLRTEGVAATRWRVTTVISVGALITGLGSLGVLVL